MKKPFLKMHGLGNDFVIFDGRADGFDLTPDLARALGDRRRGIGFDQGIVLAPPRLPGALAWMKIYNSDGSEVGACGNATRCVGKILMDETGADRVGIETIAGLLSASRAAGGMICVDMGPARLDWAEIPLREKADTLSLPVEEGQLKNPVGVSMGNPHAVFFVEDVQAVPLEALGPKIEHHPLFPARTNVEAVQVLSPARLRMRVWERGAGITQACGTGACAAAVAAIRRGLIPGRKAEVILDGGSLEIEWREADGHVLMSGSATLAFAGEVDV